MKNELIIFAAAIALLAGCSKEEGAPAAERPCIRLSTGVEAATRATDVAFEEGDNFGLIVLSRTSETAPSLDGARYLNNGLCTQTAEGVEMPTVKYPEKSADFYAYYPYREEFTAGSSFTFTVQSDQSAGRNYTNSDLMSAVRQNVAPTADAVELIFSHRLTRLDIELMPGEGFGAADELKGATVTAKNVKSSCLFNLSDGSVSEAGTPADLTPRGNGAKVTGEAIEPMQLIVVPQTLAAGEILFEIALGDETFFYAPNEELVLDGGKYYRFEIRLNRTNVSATSIRIKYPVPNGRDIFMKPYAFGFLFTVSYSSPVLRLKSQNDNPRPHGRAQEAFDYFHQPERTAMTECKHIRFANSKSAYCSTSLIFSGERFRFGIAFIRIAGERTTRPPSCNVDRR